MTANGSGNMSSFQKLVRAYGPPFPGHNEQQMNVIGWFIFLTLVVLLIPMVPIVVLIWLVSKAVGSVGNIGGQQHDYDVRGRD